ncbi:MULTISPECIES: TetR/AcrR family transcriptional regulator [unclassified Streptomyces]|uniref:TetR/AcrR family transcriptional regulator n=1 Tax=unclassified Streptomyces TaxID=2593676 RepID=UPI003812D141
MSRVSQAEARANRERVVEAASRLFRERGVANVSVADVMQAVGLTQGGFYKQFASKDALVAEAEAKGFADMLQYLAGLEADSGSHDAAVSALRAMYLSTDHRDAPGSGCPAAGFGGDAAREPEWRAAYTAGVRDMADWVAPGKAGLVGLATLVGGILLSRATAGSPLSEEILQAVREAATPDAGAAGG